MKQEILAVVIPLGVLAFVGMFIYGAVWKLMAQFDDDILWDWDYDWSMNEYCEDCGQAKESVSQRVDGTFLCDACEDIAEVERAVRS